MIILGIESSCDETAAAIVEGGRTILSSVVASSSEIHRKYGGIVPEVAARKQVESLPIVLEEAIQDCPLKDIDAIAVTVGPGLVGSLLVGIESARVLSYVWEKPLISVNHLVGHLYAAWIEQRTKNPKKLGHGASRKKEAVNKKGWAEPKFPAIGLVASGGHTDLVLIHDHGKLEYLGGTRDDAAGEAFDKIARMLGLGYPGGPAIAAAAGRFKIPRKTVQRGKQDLRFKIQLPRPMINSSDYDFSFSGLKTAVVNVLKENKLTSPLRRFLAHETQEAICEVLVSKVRRAVEDFQPQSVIVAGGVAANSRLRELLNVQCSTFNVQLFIPPVELCTDNAAYIASVAHFNYFPISWKHVRVDPGLEIVS